MCHNYYYCLITYQETSQIFGNGYLCFSHLLKLQWSRCIYDRSNLCQIEFKHIVIKLMMKGSLSVKWSTMRIFHHLYMDAFDLKLLIQ